MPNYTYRSLVKGSSERSLGTTSTDNDDGMATYLQQIGQIPRLSRADEIRLGRIVHAGCFEIELKDGTVWWDGPPEVVAAQKQLVDANLLLVVRITKNWVRPPHLILDLIDEGNIGLMRAAWKYDPDYIKDGRTEGYKFSTYACTWIAQAIQRYCQQFIRRDVRLPVHVGEMVQKFAGVRSKISMDQGVEYVPLEDIARVMRISLRAARELERLNDPVASLEAEHTHDDLSLLDQLKTEPQALNHSDPLTSVQNQDVVEELKEWMQAHIPTPRDICLLEFLWGVNTGSPKTQIEAGKEFGISSERVRQIEARYLPRLRSTKMARSFLAS